MENLAIAILMIIALLVASLFFTSSYSDLEGVDDDFTFKIVKESDTSYYAMAANGSIYYESSDASVPLNGACQFEQSRVKVGNGEFVTQNTVTLHEGVILEGVTPLATVIKQGTFSGPIIQWTPTENELWATLRDLTIYGNGSSDETSHGIYINGYGLDFIMQNVYVNNVAGDGMLFEYAWGYRVQNCKIEYCEGNGTRILGGLQGIFLNNLWFDNEGLAAIYLGTPAGYMTFEGNYIHENDQNGMYIKTSYNNIITANHFIKNGMATTNTYYGLYSAGGDHAVISANEFDGASKEKYCLYYYYTSTGTITGNYFKLGATANVKVTGGANNQFKDNNGFLTQNSGSAANATATTATWTHGLGSTPQYVWASFNDINIQAYTWTATTTQVTVTVPYSDSLGASWTAYIEGRYYP